MIEFIVLILFSTGSFSLGIHTANKKCQSLLKQEKQKCYNSMDKCKLELAKEKCKDYKIAPTEQYKECIERATK